MQFMVGDKVRIKENLRELSGSSLLGIVSDMFSMAGRVRRISGVFPQAEVPYYSLEGSLYNWEPALLEEFIEEDEKDDEIIIKSVVDGIRVFYTHNGRVVYHKLYTPNQGYDSNFLTGAHVVFKDLIKKVGEPESQQEKIRFCFEDFKEHRIVVACETETDSIAFLAYLQGKGIFCAEEDKPLSMLWAWKAYGTRTRYGYRFGRLTYGDDSCYEGIPVVSFCVEDLD